MKKNQRGPLLSRFHSRGDEQLTMNLQPIPRLENGLLRYDQTIGRKTLGPRFPAPPNCAPAWCEEAVKDPAWLSCVRSLMKIVHPAREIDTAPSKPVTSIP